MRSDFILVVEFYLLQIVFLGLMLASAEVGYRLGGRAGPKIPEQKRGQISVIEGSLIGVLALLLGFTMSMAVSRFDFRRQLVLEEANAIGTSYLRTKLLPPLDEGPQIASLLRRYLDLRIATAQAGEDMERATSLRQDALQLQTQFWARAAAWGRANPNEITSLVAQSLNRAIDLEAARWMMSFSHIPGRVVYLCALVALLSSALVGYGCGVEGHRHLFSVCLLAFAVTVVLGVIVDVDQPHHGLIRVSQQPLIDLQHQLSGTDRNGLKNVGGF